VLNYKKSEIHGHRGCRGYFPENTIQGFTHALTLNTTAIELDVVVSKDLKVVVSHEAFMHHKKCLKPNLRPINRVEEAKLILYDMNYEEIKQYDCGLLAHPNYPLLKTGTAYKPLLSEVIETVDSACNKMARTPITYNIEIKSEAYLVGQVQPEYVLYVKLVLEIIAKYNIQNRVIIQSFDKEILRTIHQINTNLPLSLLIEDALDPFEHIDQLGFIPDILASYYVFLNEDNINKLQAQSIKVFAFTVNEMNDIQEMLKMGVDAIISDYPDMVAQCQLAYI